MGNFSGGPIKNLIRKDWNKPMLKFISEKLKLKLMYLGMPGPNAEDIMEWLDYLDRVVAFQCRDYPHPSLPEQDRKYVKQLELKLLDLETKKKLTNTFVYDGYIEEVLLNGEDNMQNKFLQDEFVTVYNLDFCNQITSPLEVIDSNTKELKKVYKFYALRELLYHQSKQKMNLKKFIMFFTIHSRFRDEEADNFVSAVDSKSIKDYHDKLNKLDRVNKKIRLLKSYVYDTIKNYFCDFNFIPEFLPVINYRDKEEWLLNFTILGTPAQSVGRVNCPQKPKDFLEQKFITVINKKFVFLNTQEIEELEFEINPVSLFTNSSIFKSYWK